MSAQCEVSQSSSKCTILVENQGNFSISKVHASLRKGSVSSLERYPLNAKSNANASVDMHKNKKVMYERIQIVQSSLKMKCLQSLPGNSHSLHMQLEI